MSCPLCGSPECDGPVVTSTLNGYSVDPDPTCEYARITGWCPEIDALCDQYAWVPPAALTRRTRSRPSSPAAATAIAARSSKPADSAATSSSGGTMNFLSDHVASPAHLAAKKTAPESFSTRFRG